MSDPSDKGSESPNGMISSDDNRGTEIKKTCADCGTSKTPLWRGGPAGPKSLCNACGIKSRKKRRVVAGINKGSDGSDEMKKQKKKKKKKKNGGGLKLNPNRSGTNSRSKQLADPWKRKLLMGLGRQVSMERRIKLGEVEEAAVLLMALSYGSVYA